MIAKPSIPDKIVTNIAKNFKYLEVYELKKKEYEQMKEEALKKKSKKNKEKKTATKKKDKPSKRRRNTRKDDAEPAREGKKKCFRKSFYKILLCLRNGRAGNRRKREGTGVGLPGPLPGGDAPLEKPTAVLHRRGIHLYHNLRE